MTFLDHTGDAWPVNAAHMDWDEATNIDVDWAWVPGGGTCDHHCTPVRAVEPEDDPIGELDAGCDLVFGYHYGPVNSANHFRDSEDVIRLNRDCLNRTARFRRALVCQEMGHALGLDHAGTTASCMYQNSTYADARPRGHDINDMLDGHIYDH